MLKTDQKTINEQFNSIALKYHLLPIKVTRFFQKKVDEEVAVLGHNEGPLHRMVYPSRERIDIRDGQEVADFVEDKTNMPNDRSEFIIQKYKDRVLFLPTSNCAANCQYCFRQEILAENSEKQKNTVADQLKILDRYIDAHPAVTEIILSGGDPMTLSLPDLSLILNHLVEKKQLDSVRIHTKTLTYSPSVFKSAEKLKLLAHPKIRLVFHIAHPYEICDEVEKTIQRIQRHGIKCYNQFPLLRNINDHSALLIKHLKRLDELNIRNLSIFVPEPVYYSTAFRIPMKRIFRIMDELNWNSPAWVNATRFALDSPIGKVRREDFKCYDTENNMVVFEREGKEVLYPDLPENFDIPGELTTLLWRG